MLELAALVQLTQAWLEQVRFPFQPDFTWHRIMLKVTHLEDAK